MKPVLFDPSVQLPLVACCASAPDLLAHPTIRIRRDDSLQYGYVLESPSCDCPSRWLPFDWREGHATFQRPKT